VSLSTPPDVLFDIRIKVTPAAGADVFGLGRGEEHTKRSGFSVGSNRLDDVGVHDSAGVWSAGYLHGLAHG
jgi:hypothetical protein